MGPTWLAGRQVRGYRAELAMLGGGGGGGSLRALSGTEVLGFPMYNSHSFLLPQAEAELRACLFWGVQPWQG